MKTFAFDMQDAHKKILEMNDPLTNSQRFFALARELRTDLLRAGLAPNSSKRIFSAAKKNDQLELLVYDVIGTDFWTGEGITSKTVKQALDNAGDVKTIKLRINSPGGDVFEGNAIYSLLSQHPATVECYIDGLCASAAFTIAMAADTIHISDAGTMMCHNPWGGCIGFASDMRKTADILDKISGQMCDIYSRKSGKSPQEIQSLMDEETWFNPQEAVSAGFANDIVTGPEDAKALAASFDLTNFAKKAPASLNAEPESADDATLQTIENNLSLASGQAREAVIPLDDPNAVAEALEQVAESINEPVANATENSDVAPVIPAQHDHNRARFDLEFAR